MIFVGTLKKTGFNLSQRCWCSFHFQNRQVMSFFLRYRAANQFNLSTYFQKLNTTKMTSRLVCTTMPKMSKIEVAPEKSLYFDKIAVNVNTNLPNEDITLHLNVTNNLRINCDSITHFKTGDDGRVNLEEAAPLTTSPNGYQKLIESMGIFRMMRSRDEPNIDERFWSSDVTAPMDCKFSVYKGLFQSFKDLRCDNLITTRTITRPLMAPEVKREVFKEGRVRGTLFLPSEQHFKGPHPCILTLHGGIHRRNVVEDVGVFLASKGYATLALAYFGVDDLSKNLYDSGSFDLTYIEEAIDLVTKRPEISEDGVGFWTISKGSELVLALTSVIEDQSKIKAVVCVNTIFKCMLLPLAYKYRQVPHVQVDFNKFDIPSIGENLLSMQNFEKGLSEIIDFTALDQYALDYAQHPAPFLFTSGDDDCLSAANIHFKCGQDLRDRANKKNAYFKIYPGLGHLLDMPFSSVSYKAFHALFPRPLEMYYGGEDIEQHSLSQEKAWNDIMDFYYTNLPVKKL